MRLRLRLIVALLLALGAVMVLVRALPGLASRHLARTLSAAFQRPVAIGQVRLHAFPLEVEIEDLRVGGEGPGAPPFLEVPRVLVLPSLAPLRFGRTVLSRVRLEKPRIYIHGYPEGGDNIPRARPKAPAAAGPTSASAA